jgi:AcrR family transcriptional regulator
LNDQSSLPQHETRERIVEAARGLFFKQGYTATGMSQILEAAKANSGSLYHFFPSKEDLLAAVLEKYQSMLEPHVLQPAFAREKDPIKRLFAILEGYRLLLESTNFELGCPIGNLALEVSNSQKKARKLIIANFNAWREAVSGLIEKGADRMPADLDPTAVATYVLATMEGAVMLARAYRSFEPFDQAINQLEKYINRLVRDGSNSKKRRTRK